jgi:hypothetical protein
MMVGWCLLVGGVGLNLTRRCRPRLLGREIELVIFPIRHRVPESEMPFIGHLLYGELETCPIPVAPLLTVAGSLRGLSHWCPGRQWRGQ